MSRETDSPSPPPGDGTGASGAPEEKKTETTVTKRVRIDIPGSRPIPPVVVREKVESAPPAESPAQPPAAGPARTERAPETGEQEKVSDWFKPRTPVAADETSTGVLPAVGTAPPAGGAAPSSGTASTGGGTGPTGGGEAAVPPARGGAPVPEPGGLPAPTPLPRRERPGQGGPEVRRIPGAETSGPATGDMPLPPAGPLSRGEPPPPPVPSGGDEFGRATLDLGGPVPRPAGGLGGADTPPDGTPASGTGLFADPYDPEPDGADTPRSGEAEPAAADERNPPPARRGKLRSRLVLAVVAVGGVLVLAYGAGLLLNQHDVPAGTTVLGQDIGGVTSQEAVNRLDEVLAPAMEENLALELDGTAAVLPPSVAGLGIDTEATVGEASGTDYHPVAVLGSLAGQGREVAPVYTVDDEKLTAALEDIAAGVGSEPVEGGIELVNGVAEPRYGEAGVGIDAAEARDAVEQAFRDRAETGANDPVVLETSTAEPRVTDAEVDRMMEEFAEPAMSGLVSVSAGGQTIQFSPENSLHLFLSIQPTDDGRLVDHYDLEALEQLYGSVFDEVEVARADGGSTPVTPEDVVGALREALLETDPAQRVGVIELDPS